MLGTSQARTDWPQLYAYCPLKGFRVYFFHKILLSKNLNRSRLYLIFWVKLYMRTVEENTNSWKCFLFLFPNYLQFCIKSYKRGKKKLKNALYVLYNVFFSYCSSVITINELINYWWKYFEHSILRNTGYFCRIWIKIFSCCRWKAFDFNELWKLTEAFFMFDPLIMEFKGIMQYFISF